MKDSLRQRFERLAMRLAELDANLADPSVTSDMGRYRQLAREQSEASEVVQLYRRYEQRERDLAGARELLADPDMAALAHDEITAAEADLARLDSQLQLALLPRDPDDARNAFLEVRAGTGGEESALFAADLARMYLRHVERQGWRAEVMSESASDLGGYKELVLRVEGDGAYGKLRFESGGHRVQRVPATEAQGRIHTSACTVAVLPEPDEAAEVTLNPADLRIDTFRASGAGGQHVNKTDSAVRITHVPTGIVVQCQNERSQSSNKQTALRILKSRLLELEQERREEELAKERGAAQDIGFGSQIRSYVLHPYQLVKDHRTDHETGNTQAVLDGALDEFVREYLLARAAGRVM